MPGPTDLTDRFELVVCRDDVRPTDADLDAFEARFAVRLPDDYRTFVRALGAGEIEEVSTSSTLYAPGPHHATDLAHLNSGAPDCLSAARLLRDRIAHGPPPAPGLLDLERRVRGLVFFFLAREGEDQFAWDPADVTDPSTGDMAILRVRVERRAVDRVAATFREFIMDYLLAGRYWADTFADAAEHGFDPAKVFSYAQSAAALAEPE